ncbi:hypothetical protein EDC14_104331 [Hydrogenispora ethanolica]|jgi:hypothetical protein|uniref:Uncharacterized protein n=1 Tax=Hydrogenispora ethanolica TaxID=1082276 RepID=A0A4R1QZ78_HYDET|nr:hypothetical protein [Hydrogenispora ethanolica]TCL58295.1 hypothetical protein EDC14_104331 [Hydrogenispora ethanolica]
MKRHYAAKKMRFSLGRDQMHRYESELWNLPPYFLGKLGGELSRVMLEAAQSYIFQKSLEESHRSFDAAAFPDKKPSYQDFSDTSKNHTT